MRDDELLSAYVDGVAELTPDERARARAAASTAELADTRAVIDQLRALPPEGNEPDWAAMERAIGAAVGGKVPRPWWRGGILWLVPAAALAAAGIAIALVGHGGGDVAAPPVAVAPPLAPAAHAPLAPSVAASDSHGDPHAGHSFVYVDGQMIDVDDVPEAQILDGLTGDDDDAAPDDDNLIGTPDLAWVDHLDAANLDKLEQVLDDHPAMKRKGT